MLICTYIGPPGSVSELTTTINLDESTITFTWKYDDSSNRLPITGFDVIIVQDMGGTDPITMELSPDQLSFSLPLSRFMNQMSYTISVSVENAQGSGVPIFDPFTIPGIHIFMHLRDGGRVFDGFRDD